MASGNRRNQAHYIYHLEYLPRSELCRILDLDGKWEELAGVHMNFPVLDVKLFSKAKSPTDKLLERWGQKNHTIRDLFILLSRMQHYQAMEVLKSYVDQECHQLIKNGECNLTEILKKEIVKSKQKSQEEKVMGCEMHDDVKPSIDPRNLNDPGTGRSIRSKTLLVEPTVMESRVTVDTSRVNILPNQDSLHVEKQTNQIASSPKNDNSVVKDLIASFADLNVIQIDLSELEVATNNWDPSCLLGRGGFGTVFKGIWKNTHVAVKRMELRGLDGADLVPLKQSMGELRILNSYRHDNILPLYAYSLKTGSNPCLVYQYMPNGSLEDRLLLRQNTAPLTWEQRLNIALGTARGLQFLHTTGEKPLIHGDIKSANILLDRNFEPKIGDFGLAREGPQVQLTHMEVSRVHGTKPYLPSEYLRGRKISVKVDTYSYGIVLYELCTGLRAYDPSRKFQYLKDFVENTEDLLGLRDDHAPLNGAEIFAHLMCIGRDCAEHNPRDRPEMVKVYQRLDSLSVPPPQVYEAPTYASSDQLPDISLLIAGDPSPRPSESSVIPDISALMSSAQSSSDSGTSAGSSRKISTRDKPLMIFK